MMVIILLLSLLSALSKAQVINIERQSGSQVIIIREDKKEGELKEKTTQDKPKQKQENGKKEEKSKAKTKTTNKTKQKQPSTKDKVEKKEEVPQEKERIKEEPKVEKDSIICTRALDLFEIAKKLKSQGDYAEAKEVLLKILPCTEKDLRLRLGVYYELKSVMGPDELIAMIEEDRERIRSSDLRQKLTLLERDIYKEELSKVKPGEDRAEVLAQKVLSLDPKDKDALLILGWHYNSKGEYRRALDIFSRLYERERSGEAKEGLLVAYKGLLSKMDPSSSSALELIERILKLNPNDKDALLMLGWYHHGNKDYKKAIDIFSRLYEREGVKEAKEGLIASYKGLLSTMDLSSPAALNLIEKILKMDPNDKDAIASLGWYYYNRKDYKKASEIFSELYKKYGEEQYSKALIMSYKAELSKLDLKSPRVRSLAENILSLNPEDKDVKVILAWHYYENRDYQKALTLFEDLYSKYGEEEDIIMGLSLTYGRLGKTKELFELLRKIENKKFRNSIMKNIVDTADIKVATDPEEAFSTVERLLKKEEDSRPVVADWYCKQGFPTLAAHIYPEDKEKCFYRDQFPRIEIGSHFRSRSGLTDYSTPISFVYPIKDGQLLRFTLRLRQLNADYTDKAESLVQPEATYEVEGYPHYIISLGTTPIGGTLSPMPTFFLKSDFRTYWFSLYQKSVEDSVISISGSMDNNTKQKWGRVLKTGLSAGINLSPMRNYWLSLAGSANYLWGTNVWNNYSLEGNLALGRSFKLGKKELDVGLFYTVESYKRNTNFYTFGHGAYFSPQLLNAFGPLVRYKVMGCCGYDLDVSGSLAFISYKSDPSPVNPKIGKASGEYAGEKKSKLGGSFEINLRRALAERLLLNIYGRVRASGGYNEWILGAWITYYFLKD